MIWVKFPNVIYWFWIGRYILMGMFVKKKEKFSFTIKKKVIKWMWITPSNAMYNMQNLPKGIEIYANWY